MASMTFAARMFPGETTLHYETFFTAVYTFKRCVFIFERRVVIEFATWDRWDHYSAMVVGHNLKTTTEETSIDLCTNLSKRSTKDNFIILKTKRDWTVNLSSEFDLLCLPCKTRKFIHLQRPHFMYNLLAQMLGFYSERSIRWRKWRIMRDKWQRQVNSLEEPGGNK